MNRRNLGYIIALAALLISIPRYIAVFDGIDTVKVTAYGMGILLAGGAAYIVDAWADATKRRIKRAPLLLVALAINLAYEPLLLTPFVLSRLWDEPLANVMSMGYAVAWSVMVTLAPVLLVFGVIYAVWFHKQPTGKNEDEPKMSEAEQQPEPLKSFTCVICGAQFDNQAALSGHGNAHRTDNGRKEPQKEHRHA